LGLYSDSVTLFNSDSAQYSSAGVLQSYSNIAASTTYYGPAVSFSNFSGGVVVAAPATVAGTSPTLTTTVQVYEQGQWLTIAVTGALSDANWSAQALTTSTNVAKNFGGNAPAYAGNLLRVTVVIGGTTPSITAIGTYGASGRVPALTITADAKKTYPDNS
jgi:hypothetical protein